jgi:hypothetical protein
MVQAISCLSLIAEARVPTQVHLNAICIGQSGTVTGFSPNYLVSLSISFHRGSPYCYIIYGMNSRPIGGRGSETHSHPIDMNNTFQIFRLFF